MGFRRLKITEKKKKSVKGNHRVKRWMKPGKQPIQIGIRWWENLRRYSRKKKKAGNCSLEYLDYLIETNP